MFIFFWHIKGMNLQKTFNIYNISIEFKNYDHFFLNGILMKWNIFHMQPNDYIKKLEGGKTFIWKKKKNELFLFVIQKISIFIEILNTSHIHLFKCDIIMFKTYSLIYTQFFIQIKNNKHYSIYIIFIQYYGDSRIITIFFYSIVFQLQRN